MKDKQRGEKKRFSVAVAADILPRSHFPGVFVYRTRLYPDFFPRFGNAFRRGRGNYVPCGTEKMGSSQKKFLKIVDKTFAGMIL